jgi:hypothetical protein
VDGQAVPADREQKARDFIATLNIALGHRVTVRTGPQDSDIERTHHYHPVPPVARPTRLDAARTLNGDRVMATPPTGQIVARPILARACGCLQEFQHYAVDKYRAQRQAKFQNTRCPACVAQLSEQQRVLPKGEALKRLPAGTQVTLTLIAGGLWTGTLTANGKTVVLTGAENAGPQAVVTALARQWVKDAGADNL